MTRFLLIVLSVLSMLPEAVAQRARSVVQVRLSDGRPLSVVVNGRDYDRRGSSITIGDLPRGKHRIQVFAMRGRRMQTPELVYTGRIRVDEGTTTLMTVDPVRHSARFQVQDDDSPWSQDEDDRYQSRRDDDDDYNRGGYRNGRSKWFSDADLEDLRRRAADRITDGDKLQLIRSAIAGRRYSTAQVRAMAGMLSFESSKLDLAKSAYGGVSDPRDYWKLEDIFTFDSSKQELTDYINQRK
jgi:hypothetical protein